MLKPTDLARERLHRTFAKLERSTAQLELES